MSYVLFLMFLVAPPGATNPDWKLQSTSSMQFATYELCESAAKEIVKSIKRTPTITMVAWCFNQGSQFDALTHSIRPSNSDKDPKKERGGQSKKQKPVRLKLR